MNASRRLDRRMRTMTLTLLAGWTMAASAQLFDVTHGSGTLSVEIPDNSSVGVAHEQEVSGLVGALDFVEVDLRITSRGSGPMFNGDLYVTLTHDSGHSVLLNRVGRRASSSSGYADNGFDIRLSDAAAADVHTYRVTISGNELIPISNLSPAAPLTGTWQPDARAVDPSVVLATSSRTAGLSTFDGLNPNGVWTLFVADLGTGGLAKLDSWALHLVGVPEVPWTGMVSGALLLGAAAARRWRVG